MADDDGDVAPSDEPSDDTSAPPVETNETGRADGDDTPEDAAQADDEDWKYEVVGEDDDGPTVIAGPGDDPDAARDAAAADFDADTDENQDGEGVAGPFVPTDEIESGVPEAENVLFVAAGVFLTLWIIASVAVSLSVFDVLGLAGLVAVGSGLLYAMFRRF